MGRLERSVKIDDIDPGSYSAVFLPWGHGTMRDIASSSVLGALLSNAWAEGKVISAACHGPAGLINVRDVTGQPSVTGRRVSAFADTEELAAGLDKTVPLLLESRIREFGATDEKGRDCQSSAITDGTLFTGRTPSPLKKSPSWRCMH
ncbi:DJ-1/PfpI family protein [Chitinasiproducens palmae]|uniref:DJ-1/PfpI family protein n=1 Tax=Chitinasiproducens palmae TaxID=1770053 RepID=A0A1H2PIF0_9BURK|nr:DJ-1/PfpI family protein [Chitinasiproducens palmae]SDV46022.1 DJ-1/PfpI family protein [Chitinasiproducens palmae]